MRHKLKPYPQNDFVVNKSNQLNDNSSMVAKGATDVGSQDVRGARRGIGVGGYPQPSHRSIFTLKELLSLQHTD